MGGKHSAPSSTVPLKPKLEFCITSILMKAARRRNGTLDRRFLSLVVSKAKADPKPVHGVRSADIVVDPARGLWFRLFLPATLAAEQLPVVIFFHGGGFAFFSAASQPFDAFCRRLCKKLGVPVVSVNYRSTPEHRFPAQYDDGVDVLRFLESAKGIAFSGEDLLLREFFLAADLSCCFLAGDSAGANIAHNVARRWVAGHPRQVQLAGLVAVQPFFGGEARAGSEMRAPRWSVINPKISDWQWKAFLPDGATRDHPAANPAAAAEDLGESFPPVMVMVGENDPLLDWQRIYFRSLQKNGKEVEIIEYRGGFHAFYVFPELEGSSTLVEDVKSFILRQTKTQRGGPR